MTSRFQQLNSAVRAKRVEPTALVVAEAKTIGTPMVYALPIDNASRTGLLLNAGRNRRVPYRLNTLLELTIDPKGQAFDRPVTCIAKIVRLAQDEARRAQFGVQIVQMEAKDALAWDKAMASLEEPAALPEAG